MHLVRDRQHEGVTAPNGAGGRAHHLVVLDGGVEVGNLGGVDAMSEGGVHDNGDEVVGELLHKGEHGVVELTQTRHRPPFSGDVRSVDDDMSRHFVVQSTT